MRELERVEGMEVEPGASVEELIETFGGAGSFGAGRLGEAAGIMGDAWGDEGCTNFLGLAGAMVPAGLGPLVVQLIEEGLVDVLVSTGANLSHDLLEEFGGEHYRGCPGADDHELKEEGICRIYDVYLPEEGFEAFEEGVHGILEKLPEEMDIRGLLREVGERVSGDSILGAAAERGVDVYCPAIQDSILGLQLWSYAASNPLRVDAVGDMDVLMETGFTAERTGALLVGGGVPKNYVLQTMMTAGEGFDYAVQLTTDTPDAGGLSGATLEEAVSWGKVRGESATVYGDATITLPVLSAAARAEL